MGRGFGFGMERRVVRIRVRMTLIRGEVIGVRKGGKWVGVWDGEVGVEDKGDDDIA